MSFAKSKKTEEEAQKLGRIGDDLPAFKYEEEVDDEVDREMERRIK